MNIKTRVIHLLGGHTDKEHHDEIERLRENARKSFNDGMWACSSYLLMQANSLYGTEAEEWCRIMYDNIKTCVNNCR